MDYKAGRQSIYTMFLSLSPFLDLQYFRKQPVKLKVELGGNL